MFQSPNPFEGDTRNPFDENGIPTDPVFQRLDDDAPAPMLIDKSDLMPQLKKLYLALVAGGLILGLVISIAVLRVINHFGLSDGPQQTERVN